MSGGSVIPTSRLLSRKETLEREHACAGGGGEDRRKAPGCGNLWVSVGTRECPAGLETRDQGGHTGC